MDQPKTQVQHYTTSFLPTVSSSQHSVAHSIRSAKKHPSSDPPPSLFSVTLNRMESSSSSPAAVAERRGIPAAAFVEDVQTYLSESGLDANTALAFFQERIQQYRVVEMKLLAQQRDLKAKIPDIEKCLDIVATLQAKKGTGEDLLADFEVSEGIYSRARIEDVDNVCLWLGANVMLEYSCEEATSLLKKNLENAKASLEVLVADLQFLRDQVTITQVTTARVYNWDVHQRRLKKAVPTKDS